ncbi:hypothetical protein L3X38_035298 [Prunus dulcis]|uniref:Pectinesterase inhibitor domain-containing protein n=1 Tax=Prunus dulcis TaxID=3755 RepID=A0AAD4VKX4_PRUDU|nr:hypothetical protein L3X38_035298 [Prunus dulcis]
MDEDQEERNEILSNMIVIGVSFVVIAAVVVLVVVDVDSPKKTIEHPMNNTGIHMSLDNICGRTDYRGLCQDTLSPVGNKADVLESVLAVRSEDLFGRKSADVKSSLNAVISYQQKCLQQLPPAKAKPVLLDQALKKSIELARNALCMVHSR